MVGTIIGLAIVLAVCWTEDARWRGELYDDDDDDVTTTTTTEKAEKEEVKVKKQREFEPYDEESDPFRQLIT